MKIGLIGCGSIAQVHAKSILTLGSDFQLAALADLDRERAVKMAEEYGGEPYQDWEAMLEQADLDAVHVCTPHYLHTPMILAALQRGIHVFAEKPPVISREQLESLREAVRAAEGKTRFAVCFQNRFNPNVQYVRKILQEGGFGRVKGLRGFVTWCRGEGYYEDSLWRGRLETEGGGALINQGIHTLDLMQYLVGCAPVDADAALSNFHLKDRIEVEDTLTAYIRYPEAQAVFYVTTAYAADVPPLIELQCERGRIRMEEDLVQTWDAAGAREEIPFTAEKGFGKNYWGSGHRAAMEGFYASIGNGTPYLLDFEQVEETVELTLRIYEKARNTNSGGKNVREM